MVKCFTDKNIDQVRANPYKNLCNINRICLAVLNLYIFRKPSHGFYMCICRTKLKKYFIFSSLLRVINDLKVRNLILFIFIYGYISFCFPGSLLFIDEISEGKTSPTDNPFNGTDFILYPIFRGEEYKKGRPVAWNVPRTFCFGEEKQVFFSVSLLILFLWGGKATFCNHSEAETQ